MKTLLRSAELSCPSCVAKIEQALKGTAGVKEARVYFNTGRIEVDYDPAHATTDDLVKAVRRAGYESKVAPF